MNYDKSRQGRVYMMPRDQYTMSYECCDRLWPGECGPGIIHRISCSL